MIAAGVFACIFYLVGCGGGGGGNGENTGDTLSGHVIYAADQEADAVIELFLVDLARPGVSNKLNETLVFSGNVYGFGSTRDGTQVIYRADQETDEVFELFIVDIASPGVSRKLSDTFVTGGSLDSEFAFSLDGTQVVYLADQETDEVFELFVVDIVSPGNSTKLSDSLIAGGDVGSGVAPISFSPAFAFSPDGTQVVYLADQETDGVFELFVVDFASPGPEIEDVVSLVD